MAESSQKKWEEGKQKVESQQARVVGALFELNEGEVDFEAAKDIGLINEETREKIRSALGADEGKKLFKDALEKQKAGGKVPAEAFKQAFAAVYGKFNLEQRDEAGLEKPGSPLMKVLGKVLKFPIEEVDGVATIKGRPELMAAISRLQRVLAERDAVVLVNALKPKLEADRSEADEGSKKAAGEKADLEGKKGKIDALAGGETERNKELDDLIKALKKSDKNFRKEAELKYGFEDHKDAEASYRAGISITNNHLDELAALIAKIGLDEGSVAIDELRKEIKSLLSNPKFDAEAWKNLMDDRLASMIKSYQSEEFMKHARRVFTSDVANGQTRFDPTLINQLEEKLAKVGQSFEFLTGNFGVLKDHSRAEKKLDKTQNKAGVNKIQDARQVIVDKMSKFVSGADNIFSDGVPAKIRDAIDGFKVSFEPAILARQGLLSVQDLEFFVNGRYKQFVNETVEAIARAAEAKTTESKAADGKLQNLTAKLDRINSLSAEEVLVEDILKKAFAGVEIDPILEPSTDVELGPDAEVSTDVDTSSGVIVTIRGFETKFGHVAKQLDGAATFLSEPEKIEALDENYKKLQSLGERLQPDKLKDSLLQILGNDAQDISLDGNVRTQGSVIEATMKALERNNIQDAKGARDDEKKKNQQARVQQGIKVGRLKDLLDTINEYLKVSSAFHGELKTLVTHLEILDRAKIEMRDADDKPIHIHELVEQFNAIDPKKSDFDPSELTKLYEGFGGFFGEDTKVSALVKETKKAKKEIEDNTSLTDAACAKKITGALIARDNPDMPLADRQKIGSLLLTDGVMKIQTTESYKSLAERGGAELLDTAKQAGFADKLIRLIFKVGEKVVEPFEGLKPAAFATWEGIDNLFETNRLDFKGGFLALAAFEQFEGGGPKIEQTGKLEQKLKKLLAKELGVEERMDEAGVVQIVNEAFDKQLEAVRPLVSAFFKNVDKNLDMWTSRRVQALDMEFKALRDQRRTSHIPAELYEQKLAELVEKAEKYGVKDRVSFGRSAMLRLFGESGPGSSWLAQNNPDLDKKLGEAWNHPYAQIVRDRLADVGRYFGKTLGKMGLRVGGGAVKGGARLGGSLAWHGGVILPVKAAKYAAMAAFTPLIAGINLFKKRPWTPFSIRGAVSGDVRGLLGYVSGEGKKVGGGLLGTVKGMALEDTKGFKMEPYKPKVSGDDQLKQAKELWDKAQPDPIKMAAEPWIDLGAYKTKIGELDEIVGKKSKPKAAA